MSVAGVATSLVVAGVGWALAFAVLRQRPRHPVNRALAGMLSSEGLVLVALFHEGNVPDPRARVLVFAVGVAAAWVLVACTLLFVRHLPTPLFRRLRTPAATRALLALATAGILNSVALGAYHLATGAPFGAWADASDAGSGIAALLVSVASIVGAASAVRHATRGAPSRERAVASLAAFSANGAGIVLGVGVGLGFGPLAEGTRMDEWVEAAARAFPHLGSLLYSTILAYGILHTQMFDLELRLKAGVRRGTLVGVVLAVFVAAALAVAQLTSRGLRLEAGAVALVVAVASVVPLHRAAERVADAIFPRLADPDAHLRRRRLEVYRAALEEATAHAPASTHASGALDDLRRALAISDDEHRAALASLARADREVMPPSVRFVPERELGRGASGRAILAWDRLLERRVVLKEPIEGADARSASALAEARAAARVRHPSLVGVHEVFLRDGRPVLVLEHADAETVAARVARAGRLSQAEAARIALDVLDGLAALHDAGLVHGDVSAGNVLVGADGRARLADFGLARRAGTRGPRGGTPGYASPEQAAGREVDGRSDVYGVGALLAVLLTGAPPSNAGTVDNLAAQAAVAPPREPSAGPAARVIARALHADPRERYASARDMAADLAPLAPARE